MPLGEATRTSEPKLNRSCRACRKLKMKCWEGEDGLSCRRCQRLHMECDYSRERRGRKTNAEREALRARDVVSPESASGVSSQVQPGLACAGPSDRLQLPDLPTTEQGYAPGNWDNNPLNALFVTSGHGQFPDTVAKGSASASISPHVLSMATPNRNTGSARRRNVDMSEILDPDAERVNPLGPGISSLDRDMNPSGEADWEGRRLFEDPIDLQHLTYGEAQVLVRLFHEKLNPLIALLDPDLHTLDFMRHSSSILFTAVLAATSKFFRKELHAELLSHAHSILNRAINKATCSTGIVQAILILVYWKAPSDRSGWLKIGMACRMGYQLGWHIIPNRTLPIDELAARRLLDPERTWFCLVCFDRTYAMIFGLPSYIRVSETGDAEAWALEHRHLNLPVDMHLASSIQAPDGHEYWREFRRDMAGLPRKLVLQFIDDAMAQTLRHTSKWHGPDSDPRLFIQPGELPVLQWWDASLLFELQTRKLDYLDAADAKTATSQCLQHATRCVDLIETLAEGGQLLYLQDAGSVSLSGFGSFMRKIFWRLSSSQRVFALDLLKRVFTSCERVAANDETATTAYSARFLKRVLQTISSESRGVSRQPSPMLGAFDSLAQADQTQEAAAVEELVSLASAAHYIASFGRPVVDQQNAFLQMSATEPDPYASDQLYWSSLFSINPPTSMSTFGFQ